MPRFTKFPELRVKIKDLAEEARSIKRETAIQKAAGQRDAVQRLYLHRIQKVRPAARCALLAYGYVRGKSYRSMEEAYNHTKPDYHEISRLIRTYGGAGHSTVTWETVLDWTRTKPQKQLDTTGQPVHPSSG